MHDCLVPITAWIGHVFDSIRKSSKVPGKVRAVDMRNLLLLLPFLLHNLLEEEVEEYNRKNPFDPIVDPSDECIGIVLLFIDWYICFVDAIHQRTNLTYKISKSSAWGINLLYLCYLLCLLLMKLISLICFVTYMYLLLQLISLMYLCNLFL